MHPVWDAETESVEILHIPHKVQAVACCRACQRRGAISERGSAWGCDRIFRTPRARYAMRKLEKQAVSARSRRHEERCRPIT